MSDKSPMTNGSIKSVPGLSIKAKNAFEEATRKDRSQKFDPQAWIDESEDEETKSRRLAVLSEWKSAGLIEFESVIILDKFRLLNDESRQSYQAMETDRSTNNSTVESSSQRTNLQTTQDSTTPKARVNDADDCPVSTLPPDILAKVIKYIPIVERPQLELIPYFAPATLDAWRQLRHVNVERDFMVRPENRADASSRGTTIANIGSILQKLVDRSPYLSSLNGIDLLWNDGEASDSIIIHSLAQFEHLRSITLGDGKLFVGERKIPLGYVVEFLESTRSRTSLKELNVYRVDMRQSESAAILDRLSSSLLSGQSIKSPLRLETLVLKPPKYSTRFGLSLDNVDATRLTDIRLGEARVEPDQLINLIERTSKLGRIELSFLICQGTCNQHRLRANKKLLTALASHEYLSTLELGACDFNRECECMRLKPEFMDMLKTIGGRGRLSKFALLNSFHQFRRHINVNGVFATLCKYIPSLRSIRLIPRKDDAIADIVHLRELEDVDFSDDQVLSPNVVRYVATLPRLKRFALFVGEEPKRDEHMSAMKCLAKSTTLIDLRIGNIGWISAGVFETWSALDSFASKLQVLMLDGYLSTNGLINLLENTFRLRVLIVDTRIDERMLEAIADWCPELEILALTDEHWKKESAALCSGITVRQVQQIVDYCPKLRRLGGLTDEIWKGLQIPKNRKIHFDVDTKFWLHSLDAGIYD